SDAPGSGRIWVTPFRKASVGKRRRRSVSSLVNLRAASLPLQGGKDQAVTHAHTAVNAPDGKLDFHFLERLAPGENVLVNAVNQGAVEVEKEFGFGGRDRKSTRLNSSHVKISYA